MEGWRKLSLRSQLMVPILIGGAIVVAGVVVVMSSVRSRTVEQAGVNTAGAVAAQIVSLRGFYTEQIVSRASSAGMSISHDFEDKEKSLPLPATMVKALGRALAADNPGMSVRLYSKYPFPFRAQTERYDGFEKRALAAIELEPSKPFWSIETIDGRKSVRYAVADTMKASCVGCHNSHALSPKKDWKVGDVRGVISVSVPVDVVGAQIESGMHNLALAVFAGIGVIALATLVIASRVGRNASSLCASIESAVRDNDFTAKMQSATGAELGRIGQSVSRLMQGCGNSFRALASSAQTITEAVERVAHSSRQIQTSSQAQTEATTSTAAAVEQLTVSINQIADNTRETRQMTEQASEASKAGRSAAQQASGEMGRIAQTVCDSATMITELGRRSSEINGIAGVIKGIAEQTNLLALNAAIEAARAGDHGRGFAVVADEVRKLAERTGSATSQIEGMIGSIQQEIATAVARLHEGNTQVSEGVRVSTEVASVLDKIERDARETLERVGDVANAAGEQGAAATDIARNVERIAQMTEQNMLEVGETAASVRNLQTSIKDFESEIARFKY